MASKRKQEARAKRLARRNAQTKPGGSSRYALKRRRMLAGYDNPRSPIRSTEVVVVAVDVQADGMHGSDGELVAGGSL